MVRFQLAHIARDPRDTLLFPHGSANLNVFLSALPLLPPSESHKPRPRRSVEGGLVECGHLLSASSGFAMRSSSLYQHT